MYISTTTTALDILTPFLERFSEQEVKSLTSNIELFGEQQILANWTRDVPPGKIRDGWHMHENDRILINKLADYLPAKDKARLMRIGYDDLVALQKEYLDSHYQLLRKILANRFKGKYDGAPIDVDTFLSYASFEGVNYTEKNFRAYIAKRSFPVKNLEVFTRLIENELLEIQEGSENET